VCIECGAGDDCVLCVYNMVQVIIVCCVQCGAGDDCVLCIRCGAGDNCVVIKTEADSDDIIECSRDEKPTTGMLNSDYTLCL